MFFKTTRQVVSIAGMKCSHCAAHVKEALEAIDGVKSVDVNLEKKEAIIKSKSGIDEEAIHKAVFDAGYLVLNITTLQ